jgi:hypothetical protein
MEHEETKPRKKLGFFDIIKNLFWLLLFLQFAPFSFKRKERFYGGRCT